MLLPKIKNYNKQLIDINEMSIKLIATEDISINPKQVKFIIYSESQYDLSKDVIGFAYSNKFKLYAPYKFIWKNKNNFKLVIYNNTDNILEIKKGDYLATIKLMSIQYFNLMKKHNNSDKNLASAKINIIYE